MCGGRERRYLSAMGKEAGLGWETVFQHGWGGSRVPVTDNSLAHGRSGRASGKLLGVSHFLFGQYGHPIKVQNSGETGSWYLEMQRRNGLL